MNDMSENLLNYSIKVYKEYFNFAASHFLIFADGSREPLHGHNYRVSVQGDAPRLKDDMVFDFLDIKPIVRKVCDELDHRLLLPEKNPMLIIKSGQQGPDENNYLLSTPDESFFSIPKKDVLILPVHNTSVERLAIYLAHKISQATQEEYHFSFDKLTVEVEETPGQSAVYVHTERNDSR